VNFSHIPKFEILGCDKPLGRCFGFSVETKDSPLSKVMVPMPQIGTAIRERVSSAKFAARVEKAADELVGRYNLAKHNAYKGLRHGQFNHIFELARFLCEPRPEPIGHKCKVKFSDAATGSEVKKTSEKRGRGRKLMHPKTRPFAQEVAMAKPLGRGQTLFVKTSGLSVAEKASLT
jgi:hypothetical protein